MLLQQPDLKFLGYDYDSNYGIMLRIRHRVLLKKRTWLPNIYQNRTRFFWRLNHSIADKTFFKYTEYGNTKMEYTNVWLEIKPLFGFPTFEDHYLHTLKRVTSEYMLQYLGVTFHAKVLV